MQPCVRKNDFLTIGLSPGPTGVESLYETDSDL